MSTLFVWVTLNAIVIQRSVVWATKYMLHSIRASRSGKATMYDSQVLPCLKNLRSRLTYYSVSPPRKTLDSLFREMHVLPGNDLQR